MMENLPKNIRLLELLDPMPKRCACGELYTESRWEKLPLLGYGVFDWGEALEYRNCSCGSTLCRTWSFEVG